MKCNFLTMLCAAGVAALTSCSSPSLDEPMPDSTDERVVHTATMVVKGNCPTFDGETASRAATQWEDGVSIFLQFLNGSERIDGRAIYDVSQDQWNVEYYGELAQTNDGKCEAYYFENIAEDKYTAVDLSKNSAVFSDKDATYTFEDNLVTLTAALKPITGRIRFKGSKGQKFYCNGMSFYTGYDTGANSFDVVDGSSVFAGEINSDGYSDYFYGFYPDGKKKEIMFSIPADDVSFVRTLGDNALEKSRSGFLDLPSLDHRNGWTMVAVKTFTVSNVSFKMKWVLFSPQANKKNFSCGHNFYIAETELTQELWKAVMGKANNPSETKGDKLPVTNIDFADAQEFVANLNDKTGGKFRFPTKEEWQFAYTGGNLSQGYTFSGSSDSKEVAWSSANSEMKVHEVATLKPNELGIYDMAGNVFEFSGDIYTDSQGQFYYTRGGGYSSSYSDCYVTDNLKIRPSAKYSYCGIRLAADY